MSRCLTVIIAMALTIVASGRLLGAEPLSQEQMREVFEQAEVSFEEAARLIQTDRTAAVQLFDKAIAGYKRVLEDGGIDSGPVHYNMGNAYMLSGDVGRAILEYRRAENLMRGDENLMSNLTYARQRVRSRIDAPSQKRVARLLLFWHYDLPPQIRFTLFAGAFMGIWLLALLRLGKLPRGQWYWWLQGGLVAVSAALMISLWAEQQALAASRDGVVVAGSVVGRKGPDVSVYEPSFTDPLFSGVECWVLEERAGWLLIELGDGRETWIPSASVERI